VQASLQKFTGIDFPVFRKPAAITADLEGNPASEHNLPDGRRCVQDKPESGKKPCPAKNFL